MDELKKGMFIMGINYNAGFSQIIKGKNSYREFMGMNMLMLGKQDVNFTRGKLKWILNRIEFEYRKDIVEIDDYDERNEKIDSYDLFKLLGFDEVHALDISGYEGADIICDLSQTLSKELLDRFDYIYDGGVLEHIFNFPQALINTSRMLKKGGRIIHDLPCEWADHGFYSFSPTCLIDYYNANQFSIKNIYLVGYHYPDYEMVNVISPDCRYNDSKQWIDTFATGYKILLVCDAVKGKCSTEENISFMQYIYADLDETLKRNKVLYSYEYKIERVKHIIKDDPKSRIAIYGSGITANKLLYDLQDYLDNIVGIYDGNLKCGEVIDFDNCKRSILNLKDIDNDDVKYIVLGSEKPHVIEILRQRVKHLKRRGIQVI